MHPRSKNRINKTGMGTPKSQSNTQPTLPSSNLRPTNTFIRLLSLSWSPLAPQDLCYYDTEKSDRKRPQAIGVKPFPTTAGGLAVPVYFTAIIYDDAIMAWIESRQLRDELARLRASARRLRAVHHEHAKAEDERQCQRGEPAADDVLFLSERIGWVPVTGSSDSMASR